MNGQVLEDFCLKEQSCIKIRDRCDNKMCLLLKRTVAGIVLSKPKNNIYKLACQKNNTKHKHSNDKSQDVRKLSIHLARVSMSRIRPNIPDHISVKRIWNPVSSGKTHSNPVPRAAFLLARRNAGSGNEIGLIQKNLESVKNDRISPTDTSNQMTNNYYGISYIGIFYTVRIHVREICLK